MACGVSSTAGGPACYESYPGCLAERGFISVRRARSDPKFTLRPSQISKSRFGSVVVMAESTGLTGNW
jgi:hypothetical protein